MAKLNLRRTWVACDDFLGPYPAMISDQRWNGFVSPYFAPEVVAQIATDTALAHEQGGPEAQVTVITWDGETCQMLHPENVWPEDPHPAPETIDPVDGLYPIGVGAWVWQEVDAPADPFLTRELAHAEVAVAALRACRRHAEESGRGAFTLSEIDERLASVTDLVKLLEIPG